MTEEKSRKAGKIPFPLYFVIAAAVVGLDQLTKYLVLKNLTSVSTVPLIKNVLHLTYVENRGAAFGMLSNNRWVFMVISSLVIVVMTAYIVINRRGGVLGNVAVAFVLGGGIGNMIDRIWRGFVVDFIDFRLINFYVFNAADSFVCVGCGLLIFVLIRNELAARRAKKNRPAEGDGDGR